MKYEMKLATICLIFVLCFCFHHSMAFSQIPGSIWQMPAFTTQPQSLPAISTTKGDILVDNFEYWDSPYNHGWAQSEPAYPVYGFGMGYATIFNTILDLQEGNRVLDVYRPNAIFLIGTPFEKHLITKFLFTPSTEENPSGSAGINLDPNSNVPGNALLSFKLRAPVGIEPWDIFEFHILGTTLGADAVAGTNDDRSFRIQIRPVQPPAGSVKGGGINTMYLGTPQVILLQQGSATSPMMIRVDIGRNYMDGSWHTIWLDLNEINREAHEGSVPSEWTLADATHILAGGQMFRMDDIIFRRQDYTRMQPPDMSEPGPRYAQLFETYRYLFMAEYGVEKGTEGDVSPLMAILLDQANFITDPVKISETWLQDSNVGGIIQMDPNYLDPNHSNYGEPEPYYSDFLGRDLVIDPDLPLFSDPEMRAGGSKAAEMRTQTLQWNLTIGSTGANGIQTVSQFGTPSLVQPLPINPYDGMPTYIISYDYSAQKLMKSTTRFPSNSFNKGHYGPLECFILESALWNAGFSVWPNIAYMDFTPQYFEDLIVTLEVTNGVVSDVKTFPISVVNYPVENYPPVVQMRICNRFFVVGEEQSCHILFADPDCYIFSMAQFQGREPATTHLPALPGNQIRTDQDELIFRPTLNGMAAYQYGPWIEPIINPKNGLTTLIPKFEDVLRLDVVCTDSRGASATGGRNIIVVSPGTWLNHPPVLKGNPARPQMVRAGEELILTSPDLTAIDPDGDRIYASCNIGSCGQTADGGFIWTFQTNFPGFYNVEIIFYDMRGGYAIMKIPVKVKPWWSY